MKEIPLNGSMFLEQIEESHKVNVPCNIRNLFILELDLLHKRYLDLLYLVTLISRLYEIVLTDIICNLIEYRKQC